VNILTINRKPATNSALVSGYGDLSVEKVFVYLVGSWLAGCVLGTPPPESQAAERQSV